MILEVNTKLLEKIPTLSLNQLVFLSLVLNRNQKRIKDVSQVISRLKETEIQDLIDRNLITKEISDKKISYTETDLLKEYIKPNIDYFDQFNEIFPSMVDRPDGTRGYLKTNKKKCRDKYNQIIKGSELMHDHIIECLEKELHNRLITNKLGYMKTMWRWLTSSEWEAYEDLQTEEGGMYGTEIF